MSDAAQKRGYYREDPIKHRARARRTHQQNRDAINARKAEWYAANPEVSAARCAVFRAENPNYFREYRIRRHLKDAWLKWTRTCAASRRAQEAM